MEAGGQTSNLVTSVLGVVVQNLRGIGATSLDEFLGVQSLLPVGGSPSRQVRQELHDSGRIVKAASSIEHTAGEAAPASAASASESKSISLPSNAEPTPPTMEMDEYTRQIEECCMEWRAGRVKPYWLVIDEPKFGRSALLRNPSFF